MSISGPLTHADPSPDAHEGEQALSPIRPANFPLPDPIFPVSRHDRPRHGPTDSLEDRAVQVEPRQFLFVNRIICTTSGTQARRRAAARAEGRARDSKPPLGSGQAPDAALPPLTSPGNSAKSVVIRRSRSRSHGREPLRISSGAPVPVRPDSTLSAATAAAPRGPPAAAGERDGDDGPARVPRRPPNQVIPR